MMSAETKTCQNCKTDFTIDPEDFDFYEKLKVPPPTWCPYCRISRRLVWRNERSLYKRTCDLCKKTIIAMYPETVPFPVYCRDCWFSDRWDPLSYGRDYDFSRTFFEQFMDLFNVVPQIALQATNAVNSEYINQAVDCKNCYLVIAAAGVEDSMYSNRVLYSKNVYDCQEVHSVETGYEARQCRDSSNIYYSDDCHASFDIRFCYDVRNSHDCFMSSNLRNKSYVWRNEQLSREEYEARIAKIQFGSFAVIQQYAKEYEALRATSITRYSKQRNAIRSTGNEIANAKDCRNSFSVGDVEHANNLLFIDKAKDAHDCNNGCCTMERMYEVNCCGINCANVRFCCDAWPEVRDATYCISCRNGVHDIFGCVSLQKRSYCVLNKQYSKEEYEDLTRRIAKQMHEMPYVDAKGRHYGFGEFFPQNLSPFSFNESAAYTYTPTPKECVVARGWRWSEREERDNAFTITTEQIQDDIANVQEDIIKEVIACPHGGTCSEQCTKAYRITPTELEFYKAKGIPLPRLCSNCRHYQRLTNVLIGRMYQRQCMCDYAVHKNAATHSHHAEGRCPNTFETVYAPDRPEIVYCEQCYQAEVV